MNQIRSEATMPAGQIEEVFCPYCGSASEAEWVDIGIDIVQAGPFSCPSCKASEIGGFAPDEHYSEQEVRTGWHEPVQVRKVVPEPLCLHEKAGRTEQPVKQFGEKTAKRWQDMFRPQWLAEFIRI